MKIPDEYLAETDNNKTTLIYMINGANEKLLQTTISLINDFYLSIII